MTRDDRYPIPHIHTFGAVTAGAAVFSVIDLVRGYHQIPMHRDHVQKTAIITPFGLFEFVRMPFGLKNSAQAFQRLMDGVLRGLPFVFVYLDYQAFTGGAHFCDLHRPQAVVRRHQ